MRDAAMNDAESTFARDGWLRFGAESQLLDWAQSALPAAQAAATDPGNAHWLRCGGTWFVGVDVLPNDAQGRVGTGPPLSGAARALIERRYGRRALPLHRAQVSVCYPGYPQPMAQESETGLRFRRERDAAHVDGLLPEGAARRRHLREPHAWILGLPLTATAAAAAPPVVWTGSHHVMRAAFEDALCDHDPLRWGDVDLTEIYAAARRAVFTSCPRVVLEMQPGEACLLHRHVLHGTAPWTDTEIDSGEIPRPASSPCTPHSLQHGRIMAWFRPQFANVQDWLAAH